jgi:glutamate carboxypeptidase
MKADSKSSNADRDIARSICAYAQSHLKDIVADIRKLVELESPSRNKQAVDRCGELIVERFAQLGGKVKVRRHRDFGNQLQIDFPAPSRKSVKPILLLGHYDTVWDIGTLVTMPCRESKGRLNGPGVFDMKAGIVIALYAIAALRETNGDLPRPVTVLLNPDEEIGSPASRKVTEQLAKKSAAVLVLEPAQGLDGKVKTSRKGVGDFAIKVTGIAAHAGLDFEKGQNAVLELAQQITKASAFTDLSRGLTVSVGEVTGGSPATNVVPANAEAKFDVRIAQLRDGCSIEKKFRSLRPFNRKCTVEVAGEINRPPLERTKQVVALYELARALYAELGCELGEAAVGGGSDGNFTGALGIATLDGLGPVGEGAHASNESIIISELPKRVALVAGLIHLLGSRPSI